MKQEEINITVETTVQAPLDQVWEFWTTPEHIPNWNFASDDWCCPFVENNLQPGGDFNWRMEAKNGRAGFDFTGTYEEVKNQKLISYKMTDGRRALIIFSPEADKVKLTESFEAEGTHSLEEQKAGWQAILDNFKKYAEASKK